MLRTRLGVFECPADSKSKIGGLQDMIHTEMLKEIFHFCSLERERRSDTSVWIPVLP